MKVIFRFLGVIIFRLLLNTFIEHPDGELVRELHGEILGHRLEIYAEDRIEISSRLVSNNEITLAVFRVLVESDYKKVVIETVVDQGGTLMLKPLLQNFPDLFVRVIDDFAGPGPLLPQNLGVPLHTLERAELEKPFHDLRITRVEPHRLEVLVPVAHQSEALLLADNGEFPVTDFREEIVEATRHRVQATVFRVLGS